jgi:hypothetical protein
MTTTITTTTKATTGDDIDDSCDHKSGRRGQGSRLECRRISSLRYAFILSFSTILMFIWCMLLTTHCDEIMGKDKGYEAPGMFFYHFFLEFTNVFYSLSLGLSTYYPLCKRMGNNRQELGR